MIHINIIKPTQGNTLTKAAGPPGFAGFSPYGWQELICFAFLVLDRHPHATWSNKDKHMLGRLLETHRGPHNRAERAALYSDDGGGTVYVPMQPPPPGRSGGCVTNLDTGGR